MPQPTPYDSPIDETDMAFTPEPPDQNQENEI